MSGESPSDLVTGRARGAQMSPEPAKVKQKPDKLMR
jgi:hypothetical protein